MFKSFAALATSAALLSSFVGCAVAPSAPAAASGSVEVKFTNPEKYTDAGRFAYDRERTLKAMGEFLQSLGRQLPVGQVLKLEVLDLDLAGRLEPVRSGELRVMRGQADWPHMTLRYSLQGPGSAAQSGEAQLSDMNYLYASAGPSTMDGELAYEKRMIQRWFHDTLLTH